MGSGEHILEVQSATCIVHVGRVGEVPPPGLIGWRRVGGLPLCFGTRQPVRDMLADKLDGDLVVRPTGNNDVSKLLGGHAELLKGRLDVVDVLVEHLVKITSQLINVLENSLGEPAVRVCVDEQLHVEHTPDLRVVERENSLKEDHVHLLRPNCGEAVGNPAVGLVVVLGDLSRPALLDVPETSLHKGVVEGVRVVPVVHSLVRAGPVRSLQFPVEGVL